MSFAMPAFGDSDIFPSSYWTSDAERSAHVRETLFEIRREESLMVAEPIADIGELDHWRLEAELDRILELFGWTECERLVFDLSSIPWSCSAAVALVVALAKNPEASSDFVSIRGLSQEQQRSLEISGLTQYCTAHNCIS